MRWWDPLDAPPEGVVQGKMHLSDTAVKLPFWDRLALAADCAWITSNPEVCLIGLDVLVEGVRGNFWWYRSSSLGGLPKI